MSENYYGWKHQPYARGSVSKIPIGEHKTHIDAGALNLMASKGCRTMLDVGCGTGGQVALALMSGWGAFGIEADRNTSGAVNVGLIDLCVHPVVFHEQFDLVWCVEVAEHIPEEHEGNLIQTLTINARKHIVLTASQCSRSPVHINCKPCSHWREVIEEKGFKHDEELLKEVLTHSTMERKFLKTTGMVFTKL